MELVSLAHITPPLPSSPLVEIEDDGRYNNENAAVDIEEDKDEDIKREVVLENKDEPLSYLVKLAEEAKCPVVADKNIVASNPVSSYANNNVSRKRARTTALELGSDPSWAPLALKYLLYARKLARHTKQSLPSVRQLPSITHMITIASTDAELEEPPWRWCDAYHAIKFLKDTGLVTTSRGAKGTSIKEDAHTIDNLIEAVKAFEADVAADQQNHPQNHHHQHSGKSSTSEYNQQGQARRRPRITNGTINVSVQVPKKDQNVSFSMNTRDLRSMDALSLRTLQILQEQYKRDDESFVAGGGREGVGSVKLMGYVEKDTREFIHANTFTSVDELAQDANEIRLTVHL